MLFYHSVYSCFFIQVKFCHWTFKLSFTYVLNLLTHLILSYLSGKFQTCLNTSLDLYCPCIFSWSNIQNQAVQSHFKFIISDIEWTLSAAEPSSLLPSFIHSHSARPIFPLFQSFFVPSSFLTDFFALIHFALNHFNNEMKRNQNNVYRLPLSHLPVYLYLYPYISISISVRWTDHVPSKGEPSTCENVSVDIFLLLS